MAGTRRTAQQIEAAWLAQARLAGRGRLRRRRTSSALSLRTIVYALCLGLLIGWQATRWNARVDLPLSLPTIGQAPVAPVDRMSAHFGFCHSGGGTNCVVDGDTFWFGGEKIRIADIDTPETHGPRCAAEGALGARATVRLQELMNEGPFTLEPADRDTDRYGRALRIVTRDGQSIGAVLVAQGLAREWDGRRHPWC